jgi:hypothetical protein
VVGIRVFRSVVGKRVSVVGEVSDYVSKCPFDDVGFSHWLLSPPFSLFPLRVWKRREKASAEERELCLFLLVSPLI